MNIYLFDSKKIISFTLPYKKIGNFWIADSNGNNIVNIASEESVWMLSNNENIKILGYDGKDVKIPLKNKTYYSLQRNDDRYIMLVDDENDISFKCYEFNNNTQIKIGNSSVCDISSEKMCLMDEHATLSYSNEKWKIERNSSSCVYINNRSLLDVQSNLYNGDVINIFGLKIILTKGKIFINNIFGDVRVLNTLKEIEIVINSEIINEEIVNEEMYKDKDYFSKSPRMRKPITTYEMKIDPPPAKVQFPETPLWVTLAPMLTMAASSVVTLSTTIVSVLSKERTWLQALPSIVIALAMVCTVLIWPFVLKKFQKKQALKKEEDRQNKYGDYLDKKKVELLEQYHFQERMIKENYLSLDNCYDIITNKRRTLWERKLDQDDFLTARIGIGNVPFDVKITYHTEDFTMEDDNLKKRLETLVNCCDNINNVPINYSFSRVNKVGINGIVEKYYNFVNNLLLQFMAFHGYDELKIVLFTNKENQKEWDYFKNSPYIFSDNKEIRFFATNTEEMQNISDYLYNIYNERLSLYRIGNESESIKDYSKFKTYYLIITDDIIVSRRISIIKDILEFKGNLGFSIIIMEEQLSKVPSEITNFITIGDKTSAVIDTEKASQDKFTDEINDSYDMRKCVNILSNLPLYFEKDKKQLPNTVTFLELFGVGQVEQLNVFKRWKDNDVTKSLKTEIGLNVNADPFVLDIHEKMHGPHGLIAGMTGSGKSEFIITYILSMAINYSPEEVSFVLIDYKGGGLSGAFDNENKETLPHIVGKITNLDKNEINRALSSINSELRRRQEKFNEVRDVMGEGTIDIYKYQRLYRDGIIKEPIPHLIIVCDEFAELKSQQPEFMDDLISTARIGRSLGVHLILATQKPSGVVDAQIWSNSRFKICLKVQDKSDSIEMIKREDAAELKNVGRFYLQVGYDEYFALGQSAWAGSKYYPNKEFKKPVDKNLYFIDNIGEISKIINNTISKKSLVSNGEELTAVVKYIIDIEKTFNHKINKLWLDSIPSVVLINDLIKKYNYAKEKFVINPVIGEYDDPDNQLQGLLTLPLSKEGNALIYGMNGSGKDEFLSTFVYSMIYTYDTSEINMYLIDFGSETLVNFENAPQVGNVILNNDVEKIENLIKMLNNEIVKRKKLFVSYNGNYNDYIKQCKVTIPNIIVVINFIEAFTELYDSYVDKLSPIIRDGFKYGIYFVITTTSQNSVRFKIAQSCKQVLCLQLNNESYYKDILGKTNGIVPSSFLGRGLAKIDRVCEFQTAFISDDEQPNKYIKELIDMLNHKGIAQARKIPVMPDIVKLDIFKDNYTNITNIPLGLNKESLTQNLYDFSKNVINFILINEMNNIKNFMNNFMKIIEVNNNFSKIVIDASNYFEEFKYKIQYVDKDFNSIVTYLKGINDKINNYLVQNNMNLRSIKNIQNVLCVIVGFDKFMSKLDEEGKKELINIINMNKEVLKINFVIIDIPASVKKYEYDEWYKNNVNSNEGIFIGPGITNQFAIKTTVQPQGISLIDENYAVVVRNGMPTIVKLINEYNDKTNEGNY